MSSLCLCGSIKESHKKQLSDSVYSFETQDASFFFVFFFVFLLLLFLSIVLLLK